MAADHGTGGSVLAPFDDPAFRADLAAVHQGVRAESRWLAQEARLLARLAARVPRSSGDERGASPWTSFLREVAVARRCSDRGASASVALACRLVELPRALALLDAGDLPVLQVRALVEQTWGCSPATLAAIDDEVAARACRLSPSRVRQAVDKVVLRLEADVVAARAAAAAATRLARRVALADDQAEVALTGPAVPLALAWQALDTDARALRAAGDARGVDALRFDLAVHRLLGDHVSAAADRDAAADASTSTSDASPSPGASASSAVAAPAPAPAPAASPPPDTGSPTWLHDRRCSRPVRLDVTVPVTTALGLSQEPGWLAGHGWISAPTVRQLSVVAELRRLCVDAESGVLLDLAARPARPELTPQAVAAALRDMVVAPCELDEATWRAEPRHDPSDTLREFVRRRDGACDGPTQAQVPPHRADLDHDRPWPDGPTAAWNLVVRSERTHQLKHSGWVPVRSSGSTVWFSPAGQVVEVPLRHEPLRPLEADAALPDPVALHALEAELLRPPDADDLPPWEALDASACA